MWPFKQKQQNEIRAAGTGYTAEILAARESYIAGRSGIGELTATVQSCVSLWENGLSVADVDGTDFLTGRSLALIGRSLALRGEAVFLIRDEGLVACADWDLSTRMSTPTAYRVSVSDAGGTKSQNALAAEVLHFRVGSDVTAPYHGQSPLRRSSLTAGLLHVIESALAEVYENAPLGSQIVPMPEMAETDMEKTARGFRGNRGRVLIRESVNVSAAGGPAPTQDWKSSDVTPDISRAMTKESWSAARDAIQMAFGVLPGLSNASSTGPMVREAQRHLAQWQLQPIAEAIAEEASGKLDTAVKLDVMRPLQAYDAGGRARAFTAVVSALALAKETGVDPDVALKLVDWEKNNG